MSTTSSTTHDGISAIGVSRSFGSVAAVRSATFEALPGRVTALIGPNGSGKTTLMLMLASLLAPDAGTITVGGVDPMTDPREVRRMMGWMPDLLGSWASLSVMVALETTARLYGMSRAHAGARAAELVVQVGLEDLAFRPTRVLSRGQKQRLSLARAIVHEPRILLLDEPASGLDPSARIDLRELVRSIAAAGNTVLISSHVLSELDDMADDAVYIEAGQTASAESMAAARSSRRNWRLRTLDAEGAKNALVATGLPHDRIGLDRLGVLIEIDDEAEAGRLLTAVVSSGVVVTSFSPETGELEHIFADLGDRTDR